MIAASIYLFGRRKRVPGSLAGGRTGQWARDFTFVWILLGLLVLYVVSVGEGSYLIFVLGNIAVEILLIIYGIRSGESSKRETTFGSKPTSS